MATKQTGRINIALVGKMRSGKDTVFKYMEQALIKDTNTIPFKHAFGDEVKEITYRLFPSKNKNRDKLQQVGQKLREIDENVWIRPVDEKIEYINQQPVDELLVNIITDVRQPNEFEYAKNKGYTVKIICDDDVRIKRMEERGEEINEKLLKHETESYIDKYETDFVIYNNDDLSLLKAQVENIIETIMSENMKRIESGVK